MAMMKSLCASKVIFSVSFSVKWGYGIAAGNVSGIISCNMWPIQIHVSINENFKEGGK